MKGKRPFLLADFAAALAILWAVSRTSDFAVGQPPTDKPATHNMLVVGQMPVYLSHLPMFQDENKRPMPHRYQAILEVTLEKQDDYIKDRRKHPDTTIYTLNPEEFVLPELTSNDLRRNPLRSFKANRIFRGHLERDQSVSILRDVKVSVERVIHFLEFDSKAKKPPQLEYLIFGKRQKLFLAHKIVAPPDFDQILSVKVVDHQFADDELAKGMSVVFPKTTNTSTDRLKAKQQAKGAIKIGNPGVAKAIQVDVEGELYFEEGELQVPPVFETTTEERAAGFP